MRQRTKVHISISFGTISITYVIILNETHRVILSYLDDLLYGERLKRERVSERENTDCLNEKCVVRVRALGFSLGIMEIKGIT